MRFHNDENVSDAVALGLRRRGFDVTTTHDAGLKSARDEEQLAFALPESRVIITHDADLLRLASAGTAHEGIAYCHARKYRVGQIVVRLLALAARVTPDEIRGKVEFL